MGVDMKLEPIIKAKLEKFKEIKGYQDFDDPKAFEFFVNYHVLYAQQPDIFFGNTDILDVVSTGGHNDMSIDGIAIKIDGTIISSIDDFEAIISKNKKIQIDFVFIQSKYKLKVNMGEFNNFVFGVREFLGNDKPSQPYNEKIAYLLELKDYVLKDEFISLWKDNPSVEVHYATIGENNELPHVDALSQRLKKDIESLNLYNDIDINLIDSSSLKNLCDSNENSFDVTFGFIENMGLNEVSCVDNSCVVLCFGDEFVKIVLNENRTLRKTIFNDNVRDFQGDTTINSEIRKTIDTEPEKFVLLNNGITIVCDKFVPKNRTIMISNPQIVNGCQSSSVLYHAYRTGRDISRVPVLVKIISTLDSEVANQIVRGTNRQNIVYDEAFEITRDFHKNLEEFFESQQFAGVKYYYERRSRQFQHNPTISQWQKISLKNIIQSSIGMFFYRPDLAHMHESKLLKEFQNKIFLDTQSLYPYYMAGIANLHLENFFRTNPDKKKDYYAFKFHILMISNLLINNNRININKEKDIDAHCSELSKKIASENVKIFNSAIDIFEICRRKWIDELKRDRFRIKDVYEFVELLVAYLQDGHKSNSTTQNDILIGKVVKVSVDKHGNYFGFIEHKPSDLFFHERQNSSLEFKDLEGKYVAYKIGKNQYNNNDLGINVTIYQQHT